jgi:flavin reductase (DIM6/NTAB) family NADH-FMN oxidoreductase RutF
LIVRLDPSALSASRRYRWMISLIVPRPIAFVSTRSAGGQLNLAPFSYFMGVASDPPLLAISVSTREGEPKDTARNILETGEFVVNAATEDLAQALNQASGDWGPEVDEFALAGLTPVASEKVSPPRVGEAAFALECRLHQVLPVGHPPYDTRLILGEIVLAHLRDEILEEPAPGLFLVRADALKPIARLGKNLYTKLGDVFAMDRPRA